MATPVQIINSQVITATGQEAPGRPVNGNILTVRIVTAATSGTTPTIAFSVLWSNDAGLTYAPYLPNDGWTTITGNGDVTRLFKPKGALFKLAWVVTGTTPSFTVTAEFDYIQMP